MKKNKKPTVQSLFQEAEKRKNVDQVKTIGRNNLKGAVDHIIQTFKSASNLTTFEEKKDVPITENYNGLQKTITPYSNEQPITENYNGLQKTITPYSNEQPITENYNGLQKTITPYSNEQPITENYNGLQKTITPYSNEQPITENYNGLQKTIRPDKKFPKHEHIDIQLLLGAAKLDKAKKKILNFFKGLHSIHGNGPFAVTRDEIYSKTGVSYPLISGHLKSLVNRGFLNKTTASWLNKSGIEVPDMPHYAANNILLDNEF